MKKFGKVVYPFLLYLFLCQMPYANSVIGMPEYIVNFGNFTDNLVHILETSEPTEHRPGVHLYTPFSVGYLLANIYEKLWNVQTHEIPDALFTLKKYVATDYAALLRLFKKRQFRISSTIYTRFGNVTKPPTFNQLLTQVISLDVYQNRTEFKESIREILERGTKGHLENEMLPKKDPAWREIFDNTTHGMYVNTLHFKSEWDRPWKEIGEKKFFDNAQIPFIEIQGEYLYAEIENATAVKINLQGSRKKIVLFKPKDFTTVTNMRRIVREMLNNESIWKTENVTVQIPALNVTNLSQPSDKFPFIGVLDTFCRGRYMDPTSLVAYQNNREFLPKPPANHTQEESGGENNVDYFDILEATEEEDQRFQDYIIDARNLPILEKHFRRGNLRAETGNETESRECDPGLTNGDNEDSLNMSTAGNATMELEEKDNSTSSSKLLVFDTPFSWILTDKEIGEIFYGSISSLCTYQAAEHQIPSVPVWVLDLFKAFYLRCV